MLIAGAMIDPQGLHLSGMLTYTAIMLVLVPFAGWFIFASQLVLPTAGSSRLGAVAGLWVGGTLTGVGVIYWLYAVLGYPRPGTVIDPMGHLLIPFMPRAGLAIGLFALCMLLSSGVWGAIAPILRPEVALPGALISGCVLFLAVYALGLAMVTG
jgi:hypothetical protein